MLPLSMKLLLFPFLAGETGERVGSQSRGGCGLCAPRLCRVLSVLRFLDITHAYLLNLCELTFLHLELQTRSSRLKRPFNKEAAGKR